MFNHLCDHIDGHDGTVKGKCRPGVVHGNTRHGGGSVSGQQSHFRAVIRQNDHADRGSRGNEDLDNIYSWIY